MSQPGEPRKACGLRFPPELVFQNFVENPPVFPSSQGDPWATTLPVWTLLRARGCTPFKGRVEPEKGTLAAVSYARKHTVWVNPHRNPHSWVGWSEWPEGKPWAEVIDSTRGGGVWESNPPTGGLTRSTGFEVQGPHQQPNASMVIFQVLAGSAVG
jgi:hypothetical protein